MKRPDGASGSSIISAYSTTFSEKLPHLNAGEISEPTQVNVTKTLNLPFGGIQGKNDFGKTGYGGPCPPRGKPHRYYFRLFGLLTPSDLGKSVTRKEFDKAINGKYSEKAEFMLMFSR